MRVTSLEPEGIVLGAIAGKKKGKGLSESRAEERGKTSADGNSGSRSTIAIGKKVRITAGLAAGVVGVVHGRWPSHFGGRPQWRIRSKDLVRDRVIREDYLEVVG